MNTEIADKIISTREAAVILGRTPQTLRFWASKGKGPLKPVKIGGRLIGWRLSDVKRLLETVE